MTSTPVTAPPDRAEPRARQRVAAIVALVADAVTVVLVVLLLIRQPAFAAAVVGVSLVAIVAVVVAVTSRGTRRAVATAVTVAALVGIGAVLVVWGRQFDGTEWLALAAVIAAAVALGAGRMARRHPLPDVTHGLGGSDAGPDRHVGPRSATTAPQDRRCVLFVNERSGDGKAEDFDLVAVAEELGIEAVVLGPDDDLAELARNAVADGADVLGMAGGDGSQACVLSVAAEAGIPFVCVPAGTRNHLALDLGLDRDDPRRALTAFHHGEERRIDLAAVNGQVFVNNVALGAYAAIVDQEGYRDAKLQTTLEQLPAVMEEGGPWCDLRFDTPEHGRQTGAALLLVSNNPYDVDRASIQRRRLDEGHLGILAIAPENVREVVALTLLAAAGRPDAARALWRWEASSFRVDSGQDEVVAGIDGERCTLTPPLEFTLEHCGARVLVPPGSRLGLDEQRAGSGARYADLFEVAFNLAAGR